MSEQPFNNREIKEMFGHLETSMKTNHEIILNEVKETRLQATKTNGRVTRLEDEQGNLKVWKGFITGGLTVLSIVVVPILAWALWILANIGDEIQNGVREELASYQVTIE